MTKAEILNIMLPQMSSIIQQWDSNGIIIESQFLFASQHIMKHYMRTVYKLIVEHGGHEAEDDYPLAVATEDRGTVLLSCFSLTRIPGIDTMNVKGVGLYAEKRQETKRERDLSCYA